MVRNTNRLLPLIRLRDDVKRGGDDAPTLLVVVGDEKPSAAAGRGFDLHDVGADFLNYLIPRHKL